MGDHWYVIFVPITILLTVAGVVFRTFRRQREMVEHGIRRRAEVGARMANAAVAHATVVQSHTTTTMPGRGAAVIELRLDVMPSNGERYAARTKWEINLSSLPLVQSGQTVTVKIDPQDPATIYPGEGWAKPWIVS
ncbi:hypothetical protein [Sorangium sp. So ce1078]|uniref:hypothetical protein n=1 Tax=Sorangium sp. So ce1078 TaxID=3133329 RepID=UPI003F5F4B68